MTRAEIRIRAAEKRVAKAKAARAADGARSDAETKALAERQLRRRAPLSRALLAAEIALQEARLAACGIIPMVTVVELPATRRSAAVFCAIRINQFYATLDLLPVGKSGRVMRHRAPLFCPPDLTRLRVTGRSVAK